MIAEATIILSMFNPSPPPKVHKDPPKPPAQAAPVETPAPVLLDYMPYPFDLSANYPNTYYKGQCTRFVASHKHIPNTFGNANTWAARAAAQGITVSDIPIVGSIAWRGNPHQHVAIVVGVDSTGTITIIEQNWDMMGSIRTRTAIWSEFRYIYI